MAGAEGGRIAFRKWTSDHFPGRMNYFPYPLPGSGFICSRHDIHADIQQALVRGDWWKRSRWKLRKATPRQARESQRIIGTGRGWPLVFSHRPSTNARLSVPTVNDLFARAASGRPLFRPAIGSTMLCLPVHSSIAIDHDLWALPSNSHTEVSRLRCFSLPTREFADRPSGFISVTYKYPIGAIGVHHAAQKLIGQIWILCETKRIKPELFIVGHHRSNIDLWCLQCDHGRSRYSYCTFRRASNRGLVEPQKIGVCISFNLQLENWHQTIFIPII